MMNTTITSVINETPNEICVLGIIPANVTQVECNTDCLDTSRCYGVLISSDGDCIGYFYHNKAPQCDFPRDTVFFTHKGMIFRCLVSIWILIIIFHYDFLHRCGYLDIMYQDP